jgi:hypothetical protein
MKRLIVFLATILFLLTYYDCSNKQDYQVSENVKAGLRSDAAGFTESLKSILLKEIQTNGFTCAVSVCSDTAQILTNNFGISKGIYIKRVSFKNRNPNNYPDNFESKVLKHFEELQTEGKLNDTTEYFEVIETDGVKTVRYLKPIFVQAPCLNCHGSKDLIMSDVKTIISQKYPDDKATGYNLNDLRGAVSIKKVL